MKLNSLRAVFGAALLGAVCSAHSLTLNLTDFAQGSQTATVGTTNNGTLVTNTAVGGFKGSLADAGGFSSSNFFTYCVELTQTFRFGSPVKKGNGDATSYTIVDGLTYFSTNFLPNALAAGASTVVDRLGKLFTALGGVGDPLTTQKSVAIQLAVWESIYEHEATNPFSLLSEDTGNFKVTSGSDDTTRVEAATYLASAKALSNSLYSISVLRSGDAQDFLLIQRVPEPATLALAGLALAGLIVTRRRRG